MNPPDRVDQVRYAWQDGNLLGFKGFGPVAATLETHGELVALDQRLTALARMDSEGPAIPRWSVCRVGTPDGTAVLRRISNGEVDRGDVGLALIFHGSTSPSLGLALEGWPDWRLQEIRPATMAEVRDSSAKTHADLDKRFGRLRAEVVAVLAAQFTGPDQSHGVIVPDRVSPEDTAGLVWGVQRIMSELAANIPNPFRLYATHAPSLSDPRYQNLGLICSPLLIGPGSYSTDRIVSTPFGGAADPDELAERLVRTYLDDGGAPAVRALMQASGALGHTDLTARIRALRPASPPSPPPPPPPQPAREQPADDTLPALLELVAAPAPELAARRTTLDRLAERLSPDDRRRLCHELARHQFHLRRLREEAPVDAGRVLESLVSAALGTRPGTELDLLEWRVLLDRDQPDEVVREVWRAADALGVWQPLMPWLEIRHLHRRGYRALERGEPLARIRAAVTAQAGIVLLIGLLLGFLGGVLLV